MVRNTEDHSELIEHTRDSSMSPGQRAQRRSFASDNPDTDNRNLSRGVIARVNDDFDRIFGSAD